MPLTNSPSTTTYVSWWKCAAASCGGAATAIATAAASASTSSAADMPAAANPRSTAVAPAGRLLLREIPSSPVAPLFFFCSSCPSRMVSCESCHLLLDAERAVDGVLLCRRCGFLTVIDPTLRALLAIPAFNRSFVNRVPFAIADVVALRELIRQCEAQLQSTQQHGCTEGESTFGSSPMPSQVSPAVPSTPVTDPARKRKRATEASVASLDSQVSPPPSFRLVDVPPQPQPQVTIATLVAKSKVLKRQLHDLVRQWEQFASETTEPSVPAHLHQHPQQSFSATHLSILKAMYDKTGDKLELTALARQIEQFLVHQSTLLKMKYDLLAAVETCREIEQLHAPVFQKDDASLKVTKLLVNSTKEQLSHRYKAFQTLSRPYLALVGAANKHLFALYNAAQSLHRIRQTSESEREAVIQRELFGNNNSSSSNGNGNGAGHSPFVPADHSRSRRRYGYGAKSSHGATSSNSIGSAGMSDHPRHSMMASSDVSRVQQALEFGNRITEISKKVELWRALGSTVATTCVLSVSELSLANDTPLSSSS